MSPEIASSAHQLVLLTGRYAQNKHFPVARYHRRQGIFPKGLAASFCAWPMPLSRCCFLCVLARKRTELIIALVAKAAHVSYFRCLARLSRLVWRAVARVWRTSTIARSTGRCMSTTCYELNSSLLFSIPYCKLVVFSRNCRCSCGQQCRLAVSNRRSLYSVPNSLIHVHAMCYFRLNHG